MKVLIIAATWPEIAPLASHFDLKEGGFLTTPHFDLLISGVGMTATAFALGRHLSAKYQLVLNLGIAGSFRRNLPLGTVVNITQDEFAELGAQDGDEFLTIEHLGFGKATYTAFNNLLYEELRQLSKMRGVTVNKVNGNEIEISRLIGRLDPDTESMEGAAVLYACAQTAIPCLQIRAISNYVERRNRKNWNIGLAIKNLNDWAIGFLTNT